LPPLAVSAWRRLWKSRMSEGLACMDGEGHMAMRGEVD
jgi:hypothetical protein